MTLLRRATHVIGILAVITPAVFLILEVTDVVEGQWRRNLADALESVAFPTWPLWASGLAGAGLALVGVALIAAQIAPPKKGLNSMHEVYRGPTGETRIRGRAAIRAASHELEEIEGVVSVAGRVQAKALHLDLKIDDRSNLVEIENDARARLGHDFWINLGLADFAVNLLVTHHSKPPRAR